MKAPPIFIHSIFRSGSTYLFQVFRRAGAAYWCYQEPLHEMAVYAKDDPEKLMVGFGEKETKINRHPKLEASYFEELSKTWPAWKDCINENIIYDSYFSEDGEDIGIAYWQALSEAAKGRAVFQECRTSGRIRVIKDQMESKHIYLWRNPWDQWWSYKVTPYFDAANQLIVHARHAPVSVRFMLAELQLPHCGRSDLVGSFGFYKNSYLTSEQSYLIFYLLWCLALRQGFESADLLLNIDHLSDSTAYRKTSLDCLGELGIFGIDLSDCKIPQGRYLERDQEFFIPLEIRVHQWLSKDGWSNTDIENIQALRQKYQPVSWSAPIEQLAPAEVAEQAARARDLAIRFETNLAERTRAVASDWSPLESHMHAAKAEALHFELSRWQEDALWQQVERREVEARVQLQRALEVSLAAEQLMQQAEARTHALQIQLQNSQNSIDELSVSNDHWRQCARGLEAERNALQQSMSWRITLPLRFVMDLIRHFSPTTRHFLNGMISCIIDIGQRPLSILISIILKKPKLSVGINRWLLGRYPALHAQLFSIYAKKHLAQDFQRQAQGETAQSQRGQNFSNKFVESDFDIFSVKKASSVENIELYELERKVENILDRVIKKNAK